MHFLLLNQTFHPDVASTAQHLTDLALALANRGHEVTVVTSRRAYDDPATAFPKAETWCGIRIIRIGSTGFGKAARWRRAADFASFLALCALRLNLVPRPDAVVALTSPPLIGFLGAWLAKLRGCRFYYWVMDFNPDEAIAAGWLHPDSSAAKVLDRMSRFSLGQADRIIALDRFMRERILAKGIPPEKVIVLPPWSRDDVVTFDPAARKRFRKAHSLDGKFVIMYSGNHSPCHPLHTLMAAAERFQHDAGVAFCFVGGGSEFKRVKLWAEQGRFQAVLCLPYQPLSELAGSLSAADLHVVAMGDPFVGLVHPCKIYNVLAVTAPVLYIGPRPSHVTEILDAATGSECAAVHQSVRQGDVAGAIRAIERVRAQGSASRPNIPASLRAAFAKSTLLPNLIAVLKA